MSAVQRAPLTSHLPYMTHIGASARAAALSVTCSIPLPIPSLLPRVPPLAYLVTSALLTRICGVVSFVLHRRQRHTGIQCLIHRVVFILADVVPLQLFA